MVTMVEETNTNDYYTYDVIVVGAGVAGASAVHHLLHDAPHRLQKQQEQKDSGRTQPSGTTEATARKILVVDAGPVPGEGYGKNRKSGSATLIHQTPSKIKMMVQTYACSSPEFVRHHGRDGAKRYQEATQQGLEMQKNMAKALDDVDILNELGSYYVCPQSQRDELKEEYDFLRSLGDCCEDLQFLEDGKMDQVPGASPDFPCGIYFPRDAIIDSSEYAKRLIDVSVATKQVQFWANTRVVAVDEFSSHDHHVVVTLSTGQTILAGKVVIATGAMDPLPQLSGILMPRYSYLAHVPMTSSNHADSYPVSESPNFFTWGFSHDWCFTNGSVRVSGEDHFSAYKNPHVRERCGRLIDWTRQRYQCAPIEHDDDEYSSIPQQHGIYSETPDHVPLVGTRQDSSRICFLLGCNAWGQAILSYAASLVPALLGYRPLTDPEREALRLFSIRRFTELPASP